jgi:hypothetical protein
VYILEKKANVNSFNFLFSVLKKVAQFKPKENIKKEIIQIRAEINNIREN